jgi:hypothetical protein
MSPEERQLLAGMFERIKAGSAEPRDQEAETFINDQIKAQPSAPYLLAQTVIVQDFALQSANQKLQQLEARVRELESAPKPTTSFLGGLLGGGAPPAQRPAPPPAYGQPQSGPWGAAPPPPPGYASQQGGYAQPGFAPQAAPGFAPAAPGGFLKGALGAAAGVAGGVLLADSIRGLFHGGGGGLGIDSGFQHTGLGQGGETNVVNNYYGDASGGDAKTDASYDAADDDNSSGAQDADYEPDDGYDDGGDGGFDA